MKADNQYSTLSLSQRARVITEQARDFYESLKNGILVVTAMTIFLFFTTFTVHDIIDVIFFSIFGLLFLYLILMPIFRVKYLNRFVEAWNKDYLQQSYILVFDTTVPKGNNDVEKIYNLATAVFPELMGVSHSKFWRDPLTRITSYLESKAKNLRRRHVTVPKTWNYRTDSYMLDLVMEIDSGLFIIKDFKDNIVKLNNLKQLMNVIHDNFKQDVFRIICVANTYEETFFDMQSLERLIKKELKPKYPIDLLVKEDIGYTAMWIS